MGTYLGQLPPAELARLKAELAETLIANFCYPRFFDYRTESLRMRPVDRAKRQEVWLYLSSFDFTSWGSMDLMSPNFQLQVENLFIQFVQRNRSFFGEQGRKRMADIRMLISTSAASVVQGLRNHIVGQKQGNTAFGSPRPVVSWATPIVKGRTELSWEQISATTMALQQQLQELRGEVKPAPVIEGRPAATSSPSVAPAPASPRPIQSRIVGPGIERDRSPMPPAPATAPPSIPRPMPDATPSISRGAPPLSPAATMGTPPMPNNPASVPPLSSAAAAGSPPMPGNPISAPPMGTRQSGPLNAPVEPVFRRRSEPLVTRIELSPASNPLPPKAPVNSNYTAPAAGSLPPKAPVNSSYAPPASSPLPPKAPVNSGYVAPISGMVPTPASVPSRGLTQPTPKVTQAAAGQRDASIMPIGEDDIAIFDQMRHQLLVWMRIEAVKAGLDISNLGPAQLLEILRQQGRIDETRLQVVSTLLNLSNQVVRTGMVSILDYKQALMFHLMHTKR